MATPIIYTGQNIRAPQDQGRALQALSQFAEHQQQRDIYQLESARKDRDMLAEYLRTDPVYAFTEEIQQGIGTAIDNFTTKISKWNEQRSGNLTSQDLVYLNQERGRLNAQVGRLKALDTEVNNAFDMYQKNPGVYDPVQLQEGFEYVKSEKSLPPGGLLMPAIQSPTNLADQVLRQAGFKYEALTDPSYIGIQNGARAYSEPWGWNLGGRSSEEVANQIMSIPEMPYHALGSFQRDKSIPQETKNRYLEQAGGDETTAAINYYRDDIVDNLNRSEIRYSNRPPSTNIDRSPARTSDNEIYVDGDHAASIGQSITVNGERMDNAIVFDPEWAYGKKLPIDSTLIDWPDGLEPVESTVMANPHAVNSNVAYWVVDKNYVNKIRFTEKAIEAFPYIKKGDFEYIESEGRYRLKEGIPIQIIVPTKTEDVRGQLDNITVRQFSQNMGKKDYGLND